MRFSNGKSQKREQNIIILPYDKSIIIPDRKPSIGELRSSEQAEANEYFPEMMYHRRKI